MGYYKFRPRGGTTAQWNQANTVLGEREIGFEFPTAGLGNGAVKMKMGDGKTPWKSLAYAIDGVYSDAPPADQIFADGIGFVMCKGWTNGSGYGIAYHGLNGKEAGRANGSEQDYNRFVTIGGYTCKESPDGYFKAYLFRLKA